MIVKPGTNMKRDISQFLSLKKVVSAIAVQNKQSVEPVPWVDRNRFPHL